MKDVVIIGAGIIGCSAALNLARSGFRAHIIDSSGPGSGCSFGNAGLIAVDHVAPLASPQTVAGLPRMLLQRNSPLRLNTQGIPRMTPWMWKFVRQASSSNFARNTTSLASLVTVAKAGWRRLLDSGEIPRGLFRDIGALYVFEQAEDERTRRQLVDALDRFGVEHQDVTADEVRARYLPALKARISHGRYIPGMASVTNPQQIVQSLFDAARAAGVTFAQARVEGVSPESDGRIAVYAGGTKTVADKVLIAAGAHSAKLMEPLGIKVPLTNERGYHVELEQPSVDELKVPVSFMEAGFTCNPMSQGIRLAGTVEFGGGDKPDWRRADMLVSEFGRLFSGTTPKASSRWFGDRPTLPDYLPMIDELPTARNVFVATGHQHLGLTLAPVTGELIAQMISGVPTAVDLAPFKATRFA
jgi:D-hydroxyproline dehydrogenase